MEKVLQKSFPFRGIYPDSILIVQAIENLISDSDLYHEHPLSKFKMKQIVIDINNGNQFAHLMIKIDITPENRIEYR